jgi:hypothetical protein
VKSTVLKTENKSAAEPMSTFDKDLNAFSKPAHENAIGLNGVNFSFGTIKVYNNTTFSGNAIRIQPKLAINQPNDKYEQEADAVADSIMRMHDPPVQRKCAECEKEEEGKQVIQRKESVQEGSGEINQIAENIVGIASSGTPLPEGIRDFFEPKFGFDFSNVKIHTDAAASQSAGSIHAKAYTYKNNIVFNSNEYQPGTEAGKKLLAHELTHVVQQTTSSLPQNTIQLQPNAESEQVPFTDMPPIMLVMPRGTGRREQRRADQLQAQQQQIARDAYYGLSDSFQSFVDLWLTAANTALHQAQVPEDPTVRGNFYRALGGNMLWAATSFFRAWHPIVIAMSFAGAAVGSGIIAEDSYPTGIAEVATLLTRARDRLYQDTTQVRQDVAIECATNGITSLEEQRRVLWRHIYPSAPYNSSDALRASILERINIGLIQFRSQHEAWRRSTEAEGSHRAIEHCREANMPAGEPGAGAAQAGCNISYTRIFTDEIRQQRPFDPQLTF